ncbi:intein C-terminal splicing domain protein [Leptospira fainei serovar Hurstbridge str. BUT 6]|uniref:Intein C-terminal splicing domain protein n=1 Tax=Leptospira fainei serovar Hurstbridge str. BUT 6 TaxID=1193011 RepID=S3UZP9_9LEPT|nr:intein C-terminal splicing domain protein [Leptospira fainei serovar Hurstbridge str. BUT 6]
MDSAGNIQLDEAIYTGDAVGQGDNASNYHFTQRAQHITIGPSPAFLLGHGGGVGNIFDNNPDHHEVDRISETIGASFAGVNNFFANSNYSNAILSKLAGYDALNSANETKASMSASNQAQTAGMVADFVESVFLGGMSTQQWVAHETRNMVQNAYTTFLVNAFHLSPEAASFLAGAYMDHEAYKAAEHNMRALSEVRNVFQALGPLSGLDYIAGDLIYKIGGGLFHAQDMVAISQWRDDKTAVYGLIMTEYGKSQNWPPDTIQLASQLMTDYVRQNDAKNELGMRGQMLSIGRLEGSVRMMEASLEGPLAEAVGFVAEVSARVLQNAHVISKREEKTFDKDMRGVINSLKLVDEKNAITQWHNDQIQAAQYATAQFGKANGWSADEISKMQQVVGSYMKHKESQREFGETSGMFSLGRIEGQLKLALANGHGPMAEVIGAVAKVGLEGARDLHLITGADYKQIEGNVRQDVNAAKLKEYKDAEKNWQQEKIELAKTSVEIYGNQAGWDPAYTQQMEQIVGEYLTRQEAKAELRKLHTTEFALPGIGGLLYLDHVLFKGGIEAMVMKVARGVLVTLADIGKGFGIFSKSDTKSIYHQSKDWSDSVTGAALEAQTQVGLINKSFIKQKERELLFDFIAKAIDPNGSEQEVQNFASLLRSYMDKREAKKQAREERVNEAEQAVELVASAVISFCTAGAGSASLLETIAAIASDVKNVMTFSTEAMDVFQMVRAGAVIADVATQTVIGGEQGGTNGAIAGFVNGILSTATIAGKSPMTGFVSWNTHRNADILMGEDAKAGGWGGGFGYSTGEVSLGVSFAPGSGLDVNVNYNGGYVPKGSFLGIDYSTGSGNYTVNGGYDFNPNGTHHLGLSLSASKDGSSNAGVFYNYGRNDQETKLGPNGEKTTVPSRWNGVMNGGASLTYSNDGSFNLSGQYRGATVASVDFDPNTHKFGSVHGNANFQNELGNNVIQEHAGELKAEGVNHNAEVVGHVLSENGQIKESTVQEMIAQGRGHELLEMYQNYKDSTIKKFGQESWETKFENTAVALKDKYDLDISLKKGESSDGVIENTWTRLKSDVLLSFGVSDTGGVRSDGSKKFEFDSCFVAGTLVRTQTGFKAIEQIRVGDYVLSHNENTGKLSYEKVTETFIHDVPLIHKITYANGTTVETTWNHPFYVKGQGWTQVKDLSPSNRSVTLASIQNTAILSEMNVKQRIPIGTSLSSIRPTASYESDWSDTYAGTLGIRKIEEIRRNDRVYNLEVEGNHSYFVTKAGVLVHNYEVRIKEDRLNNTDTKALTDFSERSKPGADPKYDKFVWGDKTYHKVIENGLVNYERTTPDGLREKLRVTKDGYIQQKLQWGGFVDGKPGGEKVAYFKPNGQEAFVRKENLTVDTGSDKVSYVKPDPTKVKEIQKNLIKDYANKVQEQFNDPKLLSNTKQLSKDVELNAKSDKDVARAKELKTSVAELEKALKTTPKKDVVKIEELNKKISSAKIEMADLYKRVMIPLEMARIERVMERTFAKLKPQGTGEFLRELTSPEFNDQFADHKNAGMEIPIRVVIDYLRAQGDSKFTANFDVYKDFSRKIQESEGKLHDMANTLKAFRENPNIDEKTMKILEKDMTKNMDKERKVLAGLESERTGEKQLERIKANHNLIFAKDKSGNYKYSSDEIAKASKSAICRGDSNFMQGIANGKHGWSFGEYYMNKILSGDIEPGKETTKTGIVLDGGRLAGFDKEVARADWMPTGMGFNEANDFGGSPMSVDKTQEIYRTLKPGQVMQVWADTDSKVDGLLNMRSKPGPNHYYEIGMDEAGRPLYLNHTDQAILYSDQNGDTKALRHGSVIPPEAWNSLRIFAVYK